MKYFWYFIKVLIQCTWVCIQNNGEIEIEDENYELIDTTDKNISHCIGCNYCWLKTPGICMIKDDYKPILKKMIIADRIWLIADTKYGFVSYQAKNIIDRV